MTVAPSPYVVLLLATAAVQFGTAVYSLRQRPRPGAVPFALLVTAAGLWAGAKGIGLSLPPDPSLLLLAEKTTVVGVVVIPLAWFVFTLEYTGRPYLLTKARLVALAAVPAAVLATTWLFPGVTLTWQSVEPAATGPVRVFGVETASITPVAVTQGPLYYVFLAYSYALVFAGVVITFEFVVRYDQLYTEQVVSTVMGILVPLLGSLLAETGAAPISNLALAPFMLSVSAVAFANAVFRHRLFETVPATRRIGRASVIEGMRDAVVVTDTDDRIVDLNPTATDLFGLTLRDALGRGVGRTIPVDLDPDAETFDASVGETVHAVTVSPLADQYGRTVGRAYVFRDVTEHRHDRQRLTVLNRVLRHNLRTEINALGGYARQLDRTGEYDDEVVSRIVDASDELATLGRKAREVERVMTETPEARRVALARVVADAAASLNHTQPGVVVESTVDEGLHVTEDPGLLEAVLVDLLDAVARHDAAAAPTITVGATGGDRTVTVVVEGEGRGIPESEYAVVEAGDETPLEHASGLSLWLVKWGLARMGAEIRFDAPREGAVAVDLDRDRDAADGHVPGATTAE